MSDNPVPGGAGDEESQIKATEGGPENEPTDASIDNKISEELSGDNESRDPNPRKCSPLGITHRVFLWILLGAFLALPIGFLYLLSTFIFRPSTFYVDALRPALMVVGATCLCHQGFIMVLGVIQALQFGSYEFLRKCRASLHCVLGSYLCHILFFLPLAIRHSYTLNDRIEDIMKLDLHEWNKQMPSTPHVLDVRWERTQETYDCCGFGGQGWDYRMNFPKSCCKDKEMPCNVVRASGLNCYTLDSEVGTFYLNLTTILLWTPIPIILGLLLALRCIMPVCGVEMETNFSFTSSITTITSEDEEVEHRDLKYVKVRSHSSIDNKPHLTWQKRKWNKMTKKVMHDDTIKARMYYVKEKAQERMDKNLELYRRLGETRDKAAAMAKQSTPTSISKTSNQAGPSPSTPKRQSTPNRSWTKRPSTPKALGRK